MKFQTLKQFQKASCLVRVLNPLKGMREGEVTICFEPGTILSVDPNYIGQRHWLRAYRSRKHIAQRLWFEDEGVVWEVAA